uniref:Uncharacterized protein n=1 Tax=Marinobacter nauticus TaxID=2743 RepID=A0A455WEA0_MARNT|nr:hypothetical protein YBY_16660 [Marinobacter nauticus]
MPSYIFTLNITGYEPGTSEISVDANFSDGQSSNDFGMVGAPGDPVTISLGPVTLNGPENAWFTIRSIDSGNTLDVKTIGPYVASEAGFLP